MGEEIYILSKKKVFAAPTKSLILVQMKGNFEYG